MSDDSLGAIYNAGIAFARENPSISTPSQVPSPYPAESPESVAFMSGWRDEMMRGMLAHGEGPPPNVIMPVDTSCEAAEPLHSTANRDSAMEQPSNGTAESQ